MFIRVFSDIHLEFGRNYKIPSPQNFFISELPTDKETILCLAGDICSIESNRFHESFLNAELVDRFKKVLYVPGNHEYYNGSLMRTDDKLQEYCDKHGITFMQKKSLEIDDVVFISATLWTNLTNVHPFNLFKIAQNINDYKKIRIGPSAKPYLKNLTTSYADSLHKNHLKFIDNELYVYADRKCVVMTHHAPSYQCINEYYRQNSDFNNAYYSDLDQLILQYQPELWISGHSHRTYDFNIEKTRLINNSVGYPGEMTGFDPDLVIAI